MKLRSYIISLVLLLALVSCNSYQLLMKNYSHSVSVKHSSARINAHILVESKKIHPKKNRYYYGFKGGEIYRTESGVHGTALHGDYREEYLEGGLKEAGKFYSGLKHGVWKEWYKNGELKTLFHYVHGRKTRKYFRYSESGVVLEKGRYCKDKKVGKEYKRTLNGDWKITKYSLSGHRKIPKSEKAGPVNKKGEKPEQEKKLEKEGTAK